MLHNQSISLKSKSRFVVSNEARKRLRDIISSRLCFLCIPFKECRASARYSSIAQLDIVNKTITPITYIIKTPSNFNTGLNFSQHVAFALTSTLVLYSLRHWLRPCLKIGLGTDMDTCFDTGLGTGMVALALNAALGTGVYHLKGFCTGVDTCAVLALTRMKVPWRAQSFSTLSLDTYRHSLRHRFRALAWQLGFALACNFAFNTALGTGVYHWRGICTGVDTRAVFASTLGAMHFLQHWSVGTDMDTRFDTGLGTGMVALALNTALGTGVYHLKGFCTGVDTYAVLALTRMKAPWRAQSLSTLVWVLTDTRFDTGLGFWHGTR
ncbi:uncharacterized protein EV154DRAFT_554668 [Mucor mucedo]|uniref:uncharacterized protein n=1 Tax=Mucor mucedo TaxID=29922 RepID=UPI0022209572|nr:uncharacterized protein EV154DRAFT_554668 [Mucor mucedo]KAI7886384.1 hypothetical protein EV154DRAFT_554668 [Mucor mucedo]